MEATYCPEDDKLRLYVGRVPRDEYEALRAEGWTSTPKQDCDFVAVWSPRREDRALAYADGYIGDEDQSPADRAADRAERFAGYREKRREEAHGHADRYDAGPRAHGYQSQARAERAAARHDRQADHAVTQWSKAEYWQERTAGVIAHALYAQEPGVRMGRIKRLEAERRQYTAGRYAEHLDRRLEYERQMMEAEGGRAGHLDIEPGGLFRGALIVKVNKSNASGRVVSVSVKVPAVQGYHYRIDNVAGGAFALARMNTERAAPELYTPPTDETRAQLAEALAAISGVKKKANAAAPKLINPTPEDAERLQAIWNAQRERHGITDRDPREVAMLTQAQYSAASGGEYAPCETFGVHEGGEVAHRHSFRPQLPVACKVRAFRGSVVVLTDKPQKPLPAATWIDPRPRYIEELRPHFTTLLELARRSWRDGNWTKEENELFTKAELAGLAHGQSMSQFGLTEKGKSLCHSEDLQNAAL